MSHPGRDDTALEAKELEGLGIGEVCALTAGVDLWHTKAEEAIDLPSVRMTDGPNGARGELFGTSKAACFPCGAAQAASWDPDLVYRIGKALAEESKTKGAGVLLAPTVNLQRSPLGGRNFECFSEDPFLTATMAVAFIEGVQSEGVAACIKHFVCNEYETRRYSASSVVDERTLREIYFLPFEAAVKKARVRAVMAAYNKLNGVFCTEHRLLLTQVLREEWGFDGVVVSDWGAVHNGPAALKAGLDLEMPGPPRHMGSRLEAAVHSGALRQEAVQRAAARVYRMVKDIQAAGGPVAGPGDPESSVDSPAHRELAREAAAKSIILLRNDGLLPLEIGRLRRVAIIGSFAEAPAVQGGGSSQVRPHYTVSPLEALTASISGSSEVRYAKGWEPRHRLQSADPSLFVPLDEAGSRFTLEFFDSTEPGETPLRSEKSHHVSTVWAGLPEGFSPEGPFSARWRGTLRVPRSGRYFFGISASGRSRIFLDGELIVDNWTSPRPGGSIMGAASKERRSEVSLEADRPYAVSVEFGREPSFDELVPMQTPVTLVHLGIEEAVLHPGLGEAVDTAAWADVALVFCGTGPDWESEGFDRDSMNLPDGQDELVEAVAAANHKTVVIANCGSAIEMPWIEKVSAALLALFPGQEFGNALCDVLLGSTPPSGKLPFSIPKRLEDSPVYPGLYPEGGSVFYTDRIFGGYRHFDTKKVQPLFAFGHGLSYGWIELLDSSVVPGDTTLDKGGEAPWEERTLLGPPVAVVEAKLENRSRLRSCEVLQVYVRDPDPEIARPEKELKGFARVELGPGESRSVRIALDRRAFEYYDTSSGTFSAPSKNYEILLGFSSRDIRSRLIFHLD
jgi:beta-glucosidase